MNARLHGAVDGRSAPGVPHPAMRADGAAECVESVSKWPLWLFQIVKRGREPEIRLGFELLARRLDIVRHRT